MTDSIENYIKHILKDSPKSIPINAAKVIAHKYNYDQIIILGRVVGENGLEHLTTYGGDKENCRAAAKIGAFLKYKVMGWSETE